MQGNNTAQVRAWRACQRPVTLPHGVSVPDLLSPTHPSRPRDKLIAQVFFDLGLIERYGGGIQRILAACEGAGLPPPELENFQGGFRMVFQQLATDQTPVQVTPQVEQLLHALQGECTREFLMRQLGLRDREHFRTGYLVPALDGGLVEMTLPAKPRSRLQKYRLTETGRRLLITLPPQSSPFAPAQAPGQRNLSHD